MSDRPELRAGDVLVYTGNSFFDWIIRLKRGSYCCHVEVFVGGGMSVAARNWPKGVGKYPVRWDGLYRVYRPMKPLNIDAGMKWFYAKANGKPYDVLGLLCFTWAQAHGIKDRFFCSELARDFLVASDFDPFNPDFSSDHCAPDHFGTSAVLETVWKAQ